MAQHILCPNPTTEQTLLYTQLAYMSSPITFSPNKYLVHLLFEYVLTLERIALCSPFYGSWAILYLGSMS